MKYKLQCPKCNQKSTYECAYIKTCIDRRFECHNCKTRFGIGVTPAFLVFCIAGAALLAIIIGHPMGFGLKSDTSIIIGIPLILLVTGPIVLALGKAKKLKGKDLNFVSSSSEKDSRYRDHNE